ncbi:hypothetical protein [Candidatus Vidania fulgoroideorum]
MIFFFLRRKKNYKNFLKCNFEKISFFLDKKSISFLIEKLKKNIIIIKNFEKKIFKLIIKNKGFNYKNILNNLEFKILKKNIKTLIPIKILNVPNNYYLQKIVNKLYIKCKIKNFRSKLNINFKKKNIYLKDFIIKYKKIRFLKKFKGPIVIFKKH